MRRLLFSLLAMSLVGMMAGCSWCRSTCTHGICDCEVEDPCVNRAPWVAHGGHVGDVVTTPVAPMPVVPTPVNTPDTRGNALPSLPKKL